MNLDVSPLLEMLPSARWFGGKGRPLKQIEVLDHGVIEDGPPALALAIVRVTFADEGPEHLYHLPLIVDDGATHDAVEDLDRLGVLGDLMAHGTSIKGSQGVFQFGGPGLDPLSPPGSKSTRLLGAEQSNSSIVLDDQVVLKMFRKVEIGPNPDLELTRHLTNEGFQNIPLHVGEIVYEGELEGEEISIDLGIAQQFIPNAVEGWTLVLQHLRSFYDEVDDQDAREDMRFLTEERAHETLLSIERLGEVTALLHVALTRYEGEPDLAPEPIERFDLEAWAERARRSLVELVKGPAPELKDSAERINDRINQLRDVEDGGLKLRIHGDYHLGQAIYSTRGWMILDFEGEPARILEERREKQSPLRDVAGILRSFNYAAMSALFERAQPGEPSWDRLMPWAQVWESVAKERFLNAYLSRSHEGRFLPSDRATQMTLLDVFEIDKALYELGYEHSHRPDWVLIPLQGISQVLERDA
jgi:maltose alpha-D-glucosyltransferase/alpha-amylase